MDKNRHIDIMGIVNLTDDSFYAQSRTSGIGQTLERVRKMLDEGADIIDIGACSTRPGSSPVGADEEWRRLEPVLSAVRESFPSAMISIDTYWSEIVSRAYDLIGEFMVNDISSGQADSAMLPLVGALKLKYIAMHSRGTHQTMHDPGGCYDVVADVLTYFQSFGEKALKNGVEDWILDPGFGFSKSLSQNYELLSGLDRIKDLGRPLLVGISRKSMIYRFLNINPEESLPATQVLHLRALQKGSDMLRVHDVAEAMQTIKLYRAI